MRGPKLKPPSWAIPEFWTKETVKHNTCFHVLCHLTAVFSHCGQGVLACPWTLHPAIWLALANRRLSWASAITVRKPVLPRLLEQEERGTLGTEPLQPTQKHAVRSEATTRLAEFSRSTDIRTNDDCFEATEFGVVLPTVNWSEKESDNLWGPGGLGQACHERSDWSSCLETSSLRTQALPSRARNY